MDMNHLIGQRFNLISKSDIRYVGTLHEINPEASTIALENVVSFGTEGRRGNPTEEIPPSSSVYEYIVFRGSDVKDISVAEDKENAQPEPPQMPDDPAILGSMPRPGPQGGMPPTPHQSQPQGPRPTPPGYPPQTQLPGFYPPPYGQRFGPPPFPHGPNLPNMPYGAPPGWFPPGGFPQGPGQFPQQMPFGPPGQHQTPPPQQKRPMPPGSGPANVPKPASELPVGEKPSSKPTSRDVTPGAAAATQNAPPPPVESKPSVAEAVQAPTGPAGQRALAAAAAKGPAGPKSNRIQPAIPIATPAKPPVPAAPTASTAGNNSQNQAAVTDATRAATAAVAAAMAKLPQPNGPQNPQADVVDQVTKKMGEMKAHEGSRPQRAGYQNNRGGRGYRSGSQSQGKKFEVPKTDYDFETANARFNKQDLLKEAIASGTPFPDSDIHPPNGEHDAGDVSVDGSAVPSDSHVGYSKTSSFFDNISSEARDREEGMARGREWRGEEEKRNLETFGQGSVDGYRGRGRGRGRGSGRGRGYGRGYGRGRGGYRGRGASHGTGIPTLT